MVKENYFYIFHLFYGRLSYTYTLQIVRNNQVLACFLGFPLVQ